MVSMVGSLPSLQREGSIHDDDSYAKVASQLWYAITVYIAVITPQCCLSTSDKAFMYTPTRSSETSELENCVA